MATAPAPNHEALDRPFVHPDAMPDLYALRGYGTCMEPIIEDRALLVCDKREEPTPGDLVSVVFTRAAAARWGLPGMVKRLAMPLPPMNLRGDAVGLVVVEQINPHRRLAIPSTDVLAVHKVIGTAESNGDGTARYRPSQGRWAKGEAA